MAQPHLPPPSPQPVLVSVKPPISMPPSALPTQPTQSVKNVGPTPFQWQWYWILITSNPGNMAQLLLASGLLQLFSLGLPLFYLIIFDRVFGRQNLATLDVMAIGMVLLMGFELVLKMLRSHLLTHQLNTLDRIGLKQLLDQLFTADGRSNQPGQLKGLEQFQHILNVNQTLVSGVLQSGLDVAFSSITAVVLIAMSPLLAIVSLGALIPMALLFIWNTPKEKHEAEQYMQGQRECQKRLTEAAVLNDTLVAVNATQRWRQAVERQLDRWIDRNFSTRSHKMGNQHGLGLIMTAGSLGTLYMGAHLVLAGDLSFGTYIAVNMLSRNVLQTAMKAFQALAQTYGVMSAIKPILQETAPLETNNPIKRANLMLTQTQGHLRVEGVSVTLPTAMGNFPVLQNVSFAIQPGETIALVGASGSGKSTIVKMLQGTQTIQAGGALLDGIPIQDIDPNCLHKLVGVVPQQPGMVAGTLHENLVLGNPQVSSEFLLRVLAIAHVDEFLARLPQGLETPIESLGRNLSASQLARIALARILLMNPAVLVIDNTLASVEKPLQLNLFHQILTQYPRQSKLLVTDLMPVHQQVDRIVVLMDGQVVETGTFDQLMRQQGYYYYLYGQDLTLVRKPTQKTNPA